MAQFKILHNPRCSKSRQTLTLLKDNKVDFEIVEYLKNPPTIKELKVIIKLLGVTPVDIMRKKEDAFKESGLNNAELSESEQIKLMLAYPKVIERPIVYSQSKAAIGRPPENILEIL